MVRNLVGFSRINGRIETIAFSGSSGCAIFQVWADGDRGIIVSQNFPVLSDAEDYARGLL